MTGNPNTSRIAIVREEDIVLARQEGRAMAKNLGFGMVDQSRIATAISELARNIVRYADHGVVELRPLGTGTGTNQIGMEVIVSDEGPGIPDVELAMRDGYTTGNGLGMGLSGSRRLMDEFELESTTGKGTRITMRKWRP